MEQLHSSEDAGFTVYEGSGEASREHRSLQQAVMEAEGGAQGDAMDGFVTVGNVDSEFVKVEEGVGEEEEGEVRSDSDTASLEQGTVQEERVQQLSVESEGESGEEEDLQKSSDEEVWPPSPHGLSLVSLPSLPPCSSSPLLQEVTQRQRRQSRCLQRSALEWLH